MEVWTRWGTVLIVTSATVPFLVAMVWLLARAQTGTGADHRTAWRRSTAEVAAVAGTMPWLWMVMTPRPSPSTVNLVPLSDLALLFTAPPSTFIVQFVGNLLVFAAAGFFAPVRFHLGLPMVICLAAAGATGIEALQYILDLGRVSSIDDILLNSFGACLAALASRPLWVRRTANT